MRRCPNHNSAPRSSVPCAGKQRSVDRSWQQRQSACRRRTARQRAGEWACRRGPAVLPCCYSPPPHGRRTGARHLVECPLKGATQGLEVVRPSHDHSRRGRLAGRLQRRSGGGEGRRAGQGPGRAMGARTGPRHVQHDGGGQGKAGVHSRGVSSPSTGQVASQPLVPRPSAPQPPSVAHQGIHCRGRQQQCGHLAVLRGPPAAQGSAVGSGGQVRVVPCRQGQPPSLPTPGTWQPRVLGTTQTGALCSASKPPARPSRAPTEPCCPQGPMHVHT